jgi:hypothetical protein
MHHLLYIDPGSGSYLVQAIIAAVLGVAFSFKISGLISVLFSTSRSPSPPLKTDDNRPADGKSFMHHPSSTGIRQDLFLYRRGCTGR